MAQAVLRIEGLPASPLDAAAAFHARYLAPARHELRGSPSLALVFAPAGPEHRAWRIAAIQSLAREAAPGRVNGLAGDDPDTLAQVLDYLARAPGVTGQLLAVDGKAAQTR